ncbi:Na+/H+ antiporter subunit E [Marinospirillum alkaliphilum]|uniref:Multisubunit potassium/proton antiporter, PhaE subunit (TC 2.A.63.1.1) n=1 Tax=Marinospirillum alkaliphilum DSM 21637 TaxID=1122209 RepID=A0A1K1ZF91_9GAMM|nr:Na+/H+ antiporter subunit E [Marinospirillum alkaliphilum]SFX72922.1 multisubunit potassium/proton antiporter, PhaE subunit (TC 2.A.63.1.1) [Marinospirillum alkaliphilum DSM 21637]
MEANPRFRFLPMPTHSLLLFVVWLLLNNSAAPGHLVLGAFLAISIPLLVARLQLPQPSARKPLLAIRHFLLVLGDIITANVEVALLVVGPLKRMRPGFVAVPLDIEKELPITLLASTVSLTPGTVSCDISEDRRWLYVHALNLTDEQALIDTIKQRYEAPLKEIFGC